MIRQYGAQRCRGGHNPLRVSIIAVGGIYYIQDESFFHDRYRGRAVCRTPWQIEAFLNGTCGAARRNRDTGRWESAYRSGRSDTALVRSLRDRRQVRRISVNLLAVHEDLGLWRDLPRYPSLPDLSLYRTSRPIETPSPRYASCWNSNKPTRTQANSGEEQET